MRIANVNGRLAIVTDQGAVDVEQASLGRFTADPQAIYPRWAEFQEWARDEGHLAYARPYDPADLRSPAPRPAQLLAVGLNFQGHADETGMAVPDEPVVFTKFSSCLAGPYDTVAISETGDIDWEVELVVVMGRRADNVAEQHAWDYVAGVTVGQDLTDRLIQIRGPVPQQFSLSKSLPGFGPMGPWLVTTDEFDDPDNLLMSCSVDGRLMQKSTTRDMIFSVPQLISTISAMLPLLPGDVLFTGTPAGVGFAMKPPQYLRPGQTLISQIDGIGELRNQIVAHERA